MDQRVLEFGDGGLKIGLGFNEINDVLWRYGMMVKTKVKNDC